MVMSYNAAYYEENNQNGDRLALKWYSKIILKVAPDGPYLDFGAGTGHLIKRLPFPNWALEINDHARHSIQKNSPSTNLLNSMEHLANLDIYFGTIVALHVIEHLSDSELNEMFELFRNKLKSNGRVFLSTPSLAGKASVIKNKNWLALGDPTHINLKESQNWLIFFETNGFSLIKSAADGFYDFPYGSKFHPKNIWYASITALNLIKKFPFLKANYGENSIFVLKLKNE